MSLSFVYFDLDNTLLDHSLAERRALADLHSDHADLSAACTLETFCSTYDEQNTALWTAYSEGRIDKDDIKRERFARLLQALAVDAVPADDLEGLYLERYETHWTLAEGAEDAFHALADTFPVGILTNGFSEYQHRKLARFPEVRERLQTLVISDEFGVPKPDPRIFRHAAEQAGARPETILYIGDSWRSDVQGGLGAGWQVAWYAPTADRAVPDEVFHFSRWERLLDYLLPLAA